MKVLSALSGGVDSSVATAILQAAGHEVVGVTMKLWGGESDSGCCSVSDVEDARRSAAQLGVDHHVFNFGDEFERHVVEPYVTDHAAGRTPNPCVECNRHLKFDVLLKRAELLGFDAVATGHHARIVELPDGTRRIGRGADSAKDQSYVLYTLTARELEKVEFPIGEMTKDRVRERAAELGLRTAAKPDSQDVCFITKTNGRSEFLSARTELHPGRIIDEAGRDVGRVDAVELVTVGQRRGLNLAGGAGRRFVTDVDVAASTVTVGPPGKLLRESVELENMIWADGPVTGAVRVQTSAHGRPNEAVLSIADDLNVLDGHNGSDAYNAVVTWVRPQRRVAKGQSVVLYQTVETLDGPQEVVVAGGIAV